ncbi:unnamed protein product [Dovyalis caffra]|uniref:Uncharacterized protein n=1 Tax=Dovyalis caffra TaxID=77055 RepID=A0AAV1QR17_9ROSI|nr:unnamed protein product [Dovyalis caffra]
MTMFKKWGGSARETIHMELDNLGLPQLPEVCSDEQLSEPTVFELSPFMSKHSNMQIAIPNVS